MEGTLKSPGQALFYGVLLASCGMYFGYGIGSFNTFFDFFIKTAYGITDEAQKVEIAGNINMFFMIGGCIACFFGSIFYQTFGRFRTVIGIFVCEIIVLSLMGMTSLTLLYILRFCHGFIGCMWTLLAPLMIKENLPFSIANKVNPLFYCFLTGSIMLGYCFGSEFWGDHWKYVLMGPLAVEVPKLLLFLLIFKMESPVWLSDHRPDYIEKNFELLYEPESASKLATATREKTLMSESKTAGLSDMCQKEYRLQFFIATMLNLLNQVTGINFLVFYSKKIFEQAGMSNPTLLTIIMGFLNFLGGVFMIFTLEKIGKKRMMVAGIFGQAFGYFCFLSGMSYNIHILILIGPFIYIFSFAISLGGLIYPYVADIVPPVAISFSAFFQWIMAVMVAKYGVVITEVLGTFWTFYITMWVAFTGGVLFLGYGVDTTNKKDDEIKAEFIEKRFLQ